MAYTNTELLEAYCRKHRYDANKLEGETKVQFLSRWERKRSIQEAVNQLDEEGELARRAQHVKDSQGVSF